MKFHRIMLATTALVSVAFPSLADLTIRRDTAVEQTDDGIIDENMVGYRQPTAGSGGGDDLGSHVATQGLDMSGFGIVNIGTPDGSEPSAGVNVQYLEQMLDNLEGPDLSGYVTTGTAQVITGDKTFTGDIVVPGTPQGGGSAVNRDYVLDTFVTIGTPGSNQDIRGDKTFESDVVFEDNVRITDAPMLATDATNKIYVDNAITAAASNYVTVNTDQVIGGAPVTGAKGFTGAVTFGGEVNITTVPDDGNDAVNKAYVDTISGDLDGRVTVLEGDVATLKTDVANLQGNVTSLNSRVTTLESRTLTAGSGITTSGTLGGGITVSVNNTVLRTTGAQTVGGVKSFTDLPVIPSTAPSLAGHVASKAYVDGQIAAIPATDLTNYVTLNGAQTITGVKTFSNPIVGSVTGNAGTATALQTARTINGVAFDGSANIALPTVNTAGDQAVAGVKTFADLPVIPVTAPTLPAQVASKSYVDAQVAAIPATDLSNYMTLNSAQTVTGVKTFSNSIVGSVTGNAGTATALQTARTINGVAFNGSANITLPTVNTSGDQAVAGVKTFAALPVVPVTAPTLPAQVASKSYVDAQVAAIPATDLSNYMTLNSAQTVTGVKTFSNPILGSVTGNAGTATALQTARTINGVAFNGSANITLPTVNTSGDQSISGVKTYTGSLAWGSSGTRTETRDDAGSWGTGVRSGFYQTQTPVNFYPGAASWQHLLDIRHHNDVNNYALQIAGSFFDQNLWFRKTSNDGTRTWTQIATYPYVQTLDAQNVKLTGAQAIAGNKTFTGLSTFTGGVSVNGTRLQNVGAPTDTGDAANKAYVDAMVSGGGTVYTGSNGVTKVGDDFQADASVVRTSGAQTVAGQKIFSDDLRTNANLTVDGNLDVTGGAIFNLANPTNSSDAANKAYVDAMVSGGGTVYTGSNGVTKVGDDFQADASVVRTTGDQTLAGIKTFSSPIVGSVTGNAGTATALQTARTINGVAFNGSANITLPTVNTAGDQAVAGVKTFAALPVIPSTAPTLAGHAASKAYVDGQIAAIPATDLSNYMTLNSAQTVTGVKTFSNPILGSVTGNAGTATALQTARTINGVAFNGTADIVLPTVNTAGDQTVAGIKSFSSDLRANADLIVGGNIDVTGGSIANLANPTSSSDAANKAYVDAQVAAIPATDLSNYMTLDSAQTVTGVKTFSNPILGSVTGNAGTATALQTARTINGVAFNGTANITLPTVNTSGDQSISGVKTHTGALAWGVSGSRTETKDDAAVWGAGVRSGFYQTQTPVNYYPGAANWQHMIEARHNSSGNNYALQIAGSFFDQNLWFRKTNNDGTTAWTQVATYPYVQSLDAANVKLTGAQAIAGNKTFTGLSTFTGGISVNGTRLQNVGAPTDTADAANKAYVDAQIAAIPAATPLTGSNGVTRIGDDFQADASVVRTTGDQTLSGVKTFSSPIVGSITGNAGTATALQTARTINGVAFNGTASINVPQLRATNGTVGISTTGVAAAVNRLDVLNAVSGGTVLLRAEGTDVDIPLSLAAKGAGELWLGAGALGGAVSLHPGTQNVRIHDVADNNHVSIITGDLTANRSLTLADGDTTLSAGVMATLDTDQIISGDKTFTGANVVSGSLAVPAPTVGLDAANKAYVDAQIAAIPAATPLTGSNGVTRVGNDFRADASVVRTTGDQSIAGVKTFTGALAWGSNGSRSEMKDDAGAWGAGVRSGFYYAAAPVNYYPGAASWQHLIEARGQGAANNYALQIAGSFFDQNLWFRKTDNDGTTAWTQVATYPYVQSLDALNVKTFGAQTITGTKSFSNTLNSDGTLNVNGNGYLDTVGSTTTSIVNKGYVDNGFVNLSTAQTIAGNKTLTGSTVFTGGVSVNGTRIQNVGNPTGNGDAANKFYVDNLDGNNVKLTGDQTIAGNKTFTWAINANGNLNINNDAYMATAFAGLASTSLINRQFADDRFVNETGNETIAGIKTFSGNIVGQARITALEMFSGAYYYSSDESLKENIRPTAGLEVLRNVKPVTYEWKDGGATGMGVIAQQVETVYPFMVKARDDGKKTVDYIQLISPMLAAIQELDARVKALEAAR